MTTALISKSFRERLRMVALAGTLAISAMIPVVPGTLASTDTAAPTSVEVSADQFDIDSSGGLTGLTARVDTGGDGANLRATAAHDADILATVPDGTIVDLRVDMVDTVYDPDGVTRWWPVAVDGQDGWISGAYLSDPDTAETTVPSVPSDGTDGTATSSTVVNRTAYEDTGLMIAEISADGEGLVMRAEPDRASDKVMSLPDGTVVDLRIDMLDTVYDDQGTRWWPVSVDGVDGWVSGFYLIAPGSSSTVPTSTENATAVFAPGDTVRVETPSQGGLVVRVDPSGDSERLTSLQEGQEVQIVEGPASYENSANGWYLISTGDTTGYVDGDLLVLVTPASSASSDDPSSSDGAFAVGSWAEIQTEDGDGVNLRAGASENSDQSGFAPNQGLVEILAGPEDGWYQVRWDSQTGYIDGSLLIPAKSPTLVDGTVSTATSADNTETQSPESTESATFATGDYGKVDAGSGVGVNIRAEASQDSDRAGYLPEDSVVKITEGPETDDAGNAWYRITDGSQSGWVRGDLMTPTEAPKNAEEVATSEAEAEPDETEDTVSTEQDASTGFILPLTDFTFTQDYGCSSLGFYTYDSNFGCSVHDGVDLAAPSGTPIHAVDDGTVVAAGWCDCGLGYYVEIDHGAGLHSVYGHMASQPYVAVGQAVAQGEVIGPVGSTGLSTGPHTHFMVRQDGVTQDPKNYLPALN